MSIHFLSVISLIALFFAICASWTVRLNLAFAPMILSLSLILNILLLFALLSFWYNHRKSCTREQKERESRPEE